MMEHKALVSSKNLLDVWQLYARVIRLVPTSLIGQGRAINVRTVGGLHYAEKSC